MPALIDLLDQYLFSDAPGIQARLALRRAWELTTATVWEELYLASLDDALAEELPHLSAYSGRSTLRPTRDELVQVLAADLGSADTALQNVTQGSRAFLTELARAMQSQRLITINRHNLFTDEYRQILLNLFDHAHIRFKSVLVRNEPEFSAALATATGYDSILAGSIATYLERQFGVKLVTLNLPTSAANFPSPSQEPITEFETTDAPTPAATAQFSATPDPTAHDALDTASSITEIFHPVSPAENETLPREPYGESPNEITEIFELPQAETEFIQPARFDAPLVHAAPTRPVPFDTPVAQAAEFATEADSTSAVQSQPFQTEIAEPPAAQTEFFESETVTATPPESTPEIEWANTSIPEPAAANAPPLPRPTPNRLRVLIATPSDVSAERQLLTELVNELDARARARFGVELALAQPTTMDFAGAASLVELADIFIGAVWMHFGARAIETDADGVRYFAGTESDFALALEQGSARDDSWLRAVIYRSIRPPLDLLHLDVAAYSRVQQFFERAAAYAGDDLVRVYSDPAELAHDVRARLDAWIYNYAGDLAAALSEYGRNSAASGQINAALADYTQAIELYRELDRPEQELALWLQVGSVQQRAQNMDAANNAYDTALRLARRVEDDAAAAHALSALGALAAEAGNYRRALSWYQQARTYLAPSSEAHQEILIQEITVHTALGDAAADRADFPNAAEAYRSALALAQELGAPAYIANLWSRLGDLAAARSEWNESISAYTHAIENLNTPQDADAKRALFDAQANAHTQIAARARAANDLLGAEHAYQAALRANAQGSAKRAQRSELFRALAELADARADWERSIQAYEDALALLDSPSDLAARHELLGKQADAYQALGDVRRAENDFENANSAYRDALALYQELEVRSQEGALFYKLGALGLSQAQGEQANGYLLQALARLDAPTDADLRAEVLHAQAGALQLVGDAHQNNGEWAQAEISYMQARGNLEQLGKGAESGALLWRLGNVTAAQSRLQEALAFYQQARARVTAESESELRAQILRAEATTLARLADLRRGAGDFAQAQASFRQQLELAQELRDDALEADAFHSLGLVASDLGEWDNAVDFYDQSLARLSEPTFANMRALIQQHQLTAYEKIGERERAAHHLPQAELAYRSALALAQALNERAREADLLYTLGLLSIENENWEEALVDLRRALGIYNLLQTPSPNKPKVIWSIGRTQRGQKHAQLLDTLQRAESTRDADAYQSALELAQDLGETRTAANISQQLGALAAERADWDAALAYYQNAFAGFAQPEDAEQRTAIQRAQLVARRERSDRARLAQQWNDADADLFVALDLARELDDDTAIGELLYRRGLVAAAQSHWNQAIDLYSNALNRFDQADAMRATIESAQADAYSGLGNLERDAQNWEGTQAAYEQALILQRGIGNVPSQAFLHTALGQVATRQAQWNDALEHLTQARTLTAELDAPQQLAALDADIQLATLALKREHQADAERRGDVARTAHDYDAAYAEYNQALALAEELEDRTARAELYAKLGFIDTERTAHADALEHYRAATSLYDAPQDASQRSALLELQAHALQELGNQAAAAADWHSALDKYSQAIALLDAPAQTEQRNALIKLQALTLQNLGDQARTAQDWNGALDRYRRAVGLFAILDAETEQKPLWEREGQILAQLARSAHTANEFAAASAHYADAAARLSDAGAYDALRHVRSEQMELSRDIGDAAARDADAETARRAYRQALALAEEVEDQPAQATLYQRLGHLAATQRDWQGALLSYQYALERTTADAALARTILRDQMEAYEQFGAVQRVAGDFAAAESSLQRAYANAEALDDATRGGELAFVLGTLSADQHQWESALGYYQHALTALPADYPQRSDVKSYQALAYQEWGDAQRANGQFDAAMSAYDSGLALADELGDDARGGTLLYRVGLLAATQARWQDALDTYARAQERLTEMEAETLDAIQRDANLAKEAHTRQQLDAHLEHARIAREQKAWDDAATAYRAALPLADELNDAPTRDAVRHALVYLYADKGNALLSDEWWDEANDAYRESLALAREFEFADDVAQRQRDLVTLANLHAKFWRNADEAENAAQATQLQLEVAQEFGDVNAQADALYHLGVVAQAQQQWDAAANYFERARPLLVETENTQTLVALDAAVAITRDKLQRRQQQSELVAQAAQLEADGDVEQAHHSYREALVFAAELKDDAASAAITARLGALAIARKQWLEAKHYLEHARTLHLAQQTDADVSTLDADLARVNDVLDRQARQAHSFSAAQDAETAQRYDDALGLYRAALNLAHSLDDEPAAAVFGSALVRVSAQHAAQFFTAQDWDAAAAAHQNALTVAQEFGDANAQADALFHLGNIAREKRAWQTALDYFAQARPLFEEQQRDTELAQLEARQEFVSDILARQARQTASLEEARAAEQESEFDTAAALYRESMDLARGLGNHDAARGMTVALLTVAVAKTNALRARGDLASAENAARAQLALAQEFHARNTHADAYMALGEIQEAQDELPAARASFLQAAQLYQDAETSQGIANAHQAFERVNAILELRAQLRETMAAAQTAHALGQLTQAASHYHNALKFASALRDAATQAEIHIARGDIAAEQTEWTDALQEYAEAGALFDTLEQSDALTALAVKQSNARRNLQIAERDAARARADLAFQNAHWRDAENAYQEGLALSQTLNDSARAAEFQFALGQVSAAEQNWHTAAERYEQAAVAFIENADESRAADALQQQLKSVIAIADHHAAQEEWASAATAYTRANELAQRTAQRADQAYLEQQLGMVAAQQNDLVGALESYSRALNLLAPDDTATRHAILAEQANLWQQRGDAEMDAADYAAAEAAYLHALENVREIGNDGQRAEVAHSLGLVRAAQEQWTGAAQAHREAYNLVEHSELPEVQLHILAALAHAEQQLGEADAARAHYERALTYARALDDAAQIAEIENALGEIAMNNARWQDALEHYAAAREIYTTHANEANVRAIDSARANSYAELGELLYSEGQWQEAASAFARALELDALYARTDRDGRLLYRLGLVAAAQAEYASAIGFFDRASAAVHDEEIVLRDRILAQLAFALQQEGKRAADAGEWAQAETVFIRALKMAEASDNFDQVADLWMRLGKIYYAQARDEDAIRAYRRAYEFDRVDGNALQEREIADALAVLLLQQTRYETNRAQAVDNLQEALTFAERAENPALTGSALEALGNDAITRGENEAAIGYFVRAGRAFAEIEDTARWRTVSQQQAALLRQDAAQKLEEREFADAENLYRRAWLLQQATNDTATEGETHFGLGRALFGQERFDEALTEFDRADALLELDAPERAALPALYADTWEASGARALERGEWTEAKLFWTQAAYAREELNERAGAGLAWQQLADIALHENNFDAAMRANEQALARLDTSETRDARQRVLQQQATILAAVGDAQQKASEWANASDTYRRALGIAQEQGDLETLARLYILLGSLAAAQEHWDDARVEYQQALDVYQELEQPEAQANTWRELGDMHRQAAQYDEALDAFQAARKLYRDNNNPLGEGAMLERLGHTQGDRAEWDRAIDEYQAALHLYNDMDARRMKADVYRALERAVRNAKLKEADEASAQGEAKLDAGDWSDAQASFQEALELYREAEEYALHAQMQNQLGVALEAQTRWDEALGHYQTAFDEFGALEMTEAQVTVLGNIGDAQRLRQLWREAETAYHRALDLNQALGDTQRAGELYNSLGLAREAQKDWDGAAAYFENAVAEFERAAARDARADAANNLARVQHTARAQQLASYQRALAAARAEGNLAEVGEILNTLGLYAAEDGQYEAALEYYREAVTTFETLERQAEMDEVWRTAQGTVLNNIGDASQEIGAWRDAEYAYARALKLAREIGDRESEAILLRNLGATAQAMEQLPRALDLNLQALDTYRALGDETPRAELLERVGALQLKLEQAHAAEQTYREALDAARAANDALRVARLLKELGWLAEQRGDDARALDLYEQALPLATALENTTDQKFMLARQGVLYARAEDLERAERAQNDALALAVAQNDEPLQAELHAQLGQTAASRQDWASALTQYHTALALHEKLDARRAQFAAHERIGQVYAARGELTQADQEYHAALELAEHAGAEHLATLWQERARLAEWQNRWDDAAAYFENARRALPSDAAPETRLDLLFQRGDAAMHAHAWDVADASFNDALEIANASDNRAQYGWGMNRLGLLAQAQRAWDDALENFQEAIEILRDTAQPLGEAHVLNNIARLKLETNNAAEADLFAQAALTLAQTLGSGAETARSLYLRGIAALHVQELSAAQRYLNQAIAADPSHWAAQLQLGNTLLAQASIAHAIQQAEAGLGQMPEWELGAQTQLAIAALYQEDTRAFKAQLKRTRAAWHNAAAQRRITQEFLDAVEWILRAMEGHAESVLTEMEAPRAALLETLEAQRFAQTALLALSKSPRRFKGKPALVTRFAPPKPRTRKGGRRRETSLQAPETMTTNAEPSSAFDVSDELPDANYDAPRENESASE